MKRFLTPIVAGLLSLSILAGCGSAPQQPAASGNENQVESETPTVDRIKAAGKLVIGTSPDYPPFETLDEQMNVIGFDIDVMQEVAKDLGVELEIVQMDFGSLIEALKAGKFDIVAAGVTITEERQKQVDFSDPYIAGNDALIMHVDSNKEVSSLEDLKGLTIAVQLGTVQADALKEVEGINVAEYDLFTTAATAVAAKQADGVFLNDVVARAFVAQNPDKLKIVYQQATAPVAYAVRKDTPDLKQAVNDTLARLKESGELDALMLKWFK